jgi:hypothetical protein
MLKKATLPEILEIADAGDQTQAGSNLRRYFGLLARAGIVTQLARREPGAALTSPGFARWSLLRDLGPKAPIARHGGLYDPNGAAQLELERTP